jgi:ankyrin repeat protein
MSGKDHASAVPTYPNTIPLPLLRCINSETRDKSELKHDGSACHNDKLKEALQGVIPHCDSWKEFKNWALQLAACICSQKDKEDPLKIFSFSAEIRETIDLVARTATSYDVLSVLSWLNGIITGRYKVIQEANARCADFTDPIIDAVERAKDFNLCPHRVWAIAGSLPGRELNLPALIPPRKDLVHGHNNHGLCTFDFCESSRLDFTSVPQRHECLDRGKNLDPNCTILTFDLTKLTLPTLNGNPTAWKLDGDSIIEPSRPFMAVSHVWENGTGAGAWSDGKVNSCLYQFFCDIAKQFQCEGIWWDTICIPTNKAARIKALSNMQNHYADARITLVHDLYLRDCNWVDAERGCFAIVMSSWFTRGWTLLELARSCKVKVLFKSTNSGPVIKDLDEDILAKAGETSSLWRQAATESITVLRGQRITGVNDILSALGPRDTSKPKDIAIISGLLAGVDVSTRLSKHENISQQQIYQRILRKIAKVSQGHLFHNSATMSKGFSWCPTSLLDMALAPENSTHLDIEENGDVVGEWRVFPVNCVQDNHYVWKCTHPLIKVKLEQALRHKASHRLLVESKTEEITRALLVKLIKETPIPLRCQFVGPVYFRPPLENRGYRKVEVRIGDTEKVMEIATRTDVVETEDVPRLGHKEEEAKSENTLERGWQTGLQAVAGPVSQSATEFTELLLAAERGDEKMVRLLLERGVDIDTKDSKGRTALILAAARGDEEIVGLLVDKAANPNVQDEYNWSALQHAVWRGHSAVVGLLLKERADLNVQDEHIWASLYLGAERGDKEAVQLLLQQTGQTAPHGDVPLCDGGQTALHRGAWGGSKAVVKLLLGKMDGVNMRDNNGRTALHVAANEGHREVVQLLLENGADVEITDNNQRAALHEAAMKGHEAAVRRLIDSGASFNSEDKDGQTPLCLAVWNGHEAVVPLLVGKEPIRATYEIIVRQMVDGKVDINDRDLQGETALIWGARNGRDAVMRLLLDKKPDVEAKDSHGKTALTWAVQNGHEVAARLVVNNGANIKAKDKDGWTALHRVAEKGHERVARLLVNKGADVNARDNRGQTPLHIAAQHWHEAVARLLVETGANVDAIDNDGRTMLYWVTKKWKEGRIKEEETSTEDNDKGTVLHQAAKHGHEKLVRLLLLLGKEANLEEKDNEGRTALHWAALEGNMIVAQLLVENRANIEMRDSSGQTALHIAAENNHKAIVKLLLDKGSNVDPRDNKGRTPLLQAVHNGSEAAVKLLLDKGADKDSKDDDNETPLWQAILNGHEALINLLQEKGAILSSGDNSNQTALWQAVDKGHDVVMRYLFEKGTNMDVKNEDGNTLLSQAVENGHLGVVKFLLGNVADANSQDDSGDCPLLHAPYGGNAEIAKLLLDNGAEVDCKDSDENTPLMLAAGTGNQKMVEVLLEGGAYIHSKGKYGGTPLYRATVKVGSEFDESIEETEAMLKLLLANDADINSRCWLGNTPLNCAARKGDNDMVKLLLDHDADINCQGSHDQTPLHDAVSSELPETAQLLLDRGADPNSVDDNGSSALYSAVSKGHVAMARLLLEAGADVDCENKDGVRPLHFVALRWQLVMVRLLREYGAEVEGKLLRSVDDDMKKILLEERG